MVSIVVKQKDAKDSYRLKKGFGPTTRMRAQVSIEYLMITGFSLMLLAPLLIVYANQSAYVNDQYALNQARTAVEDLGQAADRVYFAGPPSKETLIITIPEGVNDFIITEQGVRMRVAGTSAYFSTSAQLVPATLNPRAGRAPISIEATSSGVVFSEP